MDCKPSTSDVLIEAVPNFSEGRDPAVIEALVAAIQAPGVRLLHRTSDHDHHRTVLTVAGPPDAVLAGLLAAVRVATERIDLTRHHGVHPRLGATDVVPLVPLRGISLEECATLARALGKRIGEELGLPVYLYATAATRADRRVLADVRRGGYERLAAEIHLPHRAPDFGPARVGPAGAVIVGARPILIAYNLFLATADVTVAQRIAAAIRERGGGLPGVRALGLLVDGQAQVSINLEDYRLTPLHSVVARVRHLAQEAGVAIARGELIGLLPQDALLQAAAYALHLPSLTLEQTIEGALAASTAAPAPHEAPG